jgi:hypothetical protein
LNSQTNTPDNKPENFCDVQIEEFVAALSGSDHHKVRIFMAKSSGKRFFVSSASMRTRVRPSILIAVVLVVGLAFATAESIVAESFTDSSCSVQKTLPQ